jgi:hypothetical protein
VDALGHEDFDAWKTRAAAEQFDDGYRPATNDE